MTYQKGFSLIEVLISFALVTTLGFFLLEEQLRTQSLLTQLICRANASGYLDEVNELLAIDANVLPKTPLPYHLRRIHAQDRETIQIRWFMDAHMIERKQYIISEL